MIKSRHPVSSGKSHALARVVKFAITGVYAVVTVLGVVLTTTPMPVSAAADVAPCPASWQVGSIMNKIRHNGTAAPTEAGQILKTAIENGYPVVLIGTALDSDYPNIQGIVWNDNGGESGYVEMWPNYGTGTEYVFRANNVDGYGTLVNFQIDGASGLPRYVWDFTEDETPPFGSTLSASTTNWNTPTSYSQDYMQDGTNQCILAIGGRISRPHGTEQPYLTLADLDQQAPPVDHGWNVVDWLKEFWKFITNIPEMLYELLVPDATTISAITTNFSEFFSDKLGFLYWPFDFISDVFALLMGTGISHEFDDFGNTYNACDVITPNTTAAPWSFGQFLGSGYGINPCMFEYVLPSIFTFATLAARALLVYAVVNYLLNAYRRHVK